MTPERKINDALELAIECASTDGGHHKAWYNDQIVRVLAGDKYDQVVSEAQDGEDGPETFPWDEGIAPWPIDNGEEK